MRLYLEHTLKYDIARCIILLSFFILHFSTYDLLFKHRAFNVISLQNFRHCDWLKEKTRLILFRRDLSLKKLLSSLTISFIIQTINHGDESCAIH